MRLALRLGKTLHQIKQEVSSSELAKWMAFDRIEPFTIDRTELIVASFMALIANMSSKKRQFKANDFLPFAQKKHETDMTKVQSIMRGMYGANKSIKH